MALGMALEGPQHLSVLSGKAEGAGGLVVAPDPGVKPLGKLRTWVTLVSTWRLESHPIQGAVSAALVGAKGCRERPEDRTPCRPPAWRNA